VGKRKLEKGGTNWERVLCTKKKRKGAGFDRSSRVGEKEKRWHPEKVSNEKRLTHRQNVRSALAQETGKIKRGTKDLGVKKSSWWKEVKGANSDTS